MKVWLLVLVLGLACCQASGPALAAKPAAPEPARSDVSARNAVDKGWTYFDRGDLRRALRLFHQAAQAVPTFAPAYFGQAFVYSRQQRWDLAETNYLKTLELDPDFAEAYGNLAVVYWSQGKAPQAAPFVRRSLGWPPGPHGA